jgi:hypothetical protein
VSGENHWHTGWNFIQLFNENRALGLKGFDDKAVVDNFMANIHGRTMRLQRLFNDKDGAVDPGAKTPGAGKHDGKGGYGHC